MVSSQTLRAEKFRFFLGYFSDAFLDDQKLFFSSNIVELIVQFHLSDILF